MRHIGIGLHLIVQLVQVELLLLLFHLLQYVRGQVAKGRDVDVDGVQSANRGRAMKSRRLMVRETREGKLNG